MLKEKNWSSPHPNTVPEIVGGLCGNAPVYLRLGNYEKITFSMVGNQMLCGSLEEGFCQWRKWNSSFRMRIDSPLYLSSDKGELDQIIGLDTWLFGCWRYIRDIKTSLGRGSRIVSWFLCRELPWAPRHLKGLISKSGYNDSETILYLHSHKHQQRPKLLSQKLVSRGF